MLAHPEYPSPTPRIAGRLRPALSDRDRRDPTDAQVGLGAQMQITTAIMECRHGRV